MSKFFNVPVILDEHPEAMEALLRESLRRPSHDVISDERRVELEISLVTVLMYQKKMKEARDIVHSVLQTHPEHELALRYEMRLAFYLNDPWPGAWEKIEARWGAELAGEKPILTEKLWDGSRLGGRSILFAGEAGLGDHVMLIRFAKSLKERGAGRVVVSASRSLHPLLRSAPGVDEVIAFEDRDRALQCDVSIPMFSAPYRLGITLETLPRDVPYFSVPDANTTAQRTRIDRLPDTLNVGLCWKSGGESRRLPLSLFRPLAEIPGVRLYGIGKPSQIEEEMAGFPISGLACSDILSTAGALLSLDLIISVDTMVAHLAGSLACPAWLLLKYFPDWKWGLTGERTPWYPTMRLFRQESREWMPVIREIGDQLHGLVSNLAARRSASMLG